MTDETEDPRAMTIDTVGPRGGLRARVLVWRSAGFAAIPLSFLLPLLLAACSPAADPPDDGSQAPAPRITAEHPVTARPALEAGLLDGGTMGGGSVLGEAGSVDGLDAGGVALAAVLPAADVADSIDFYTGLLGFDVTSSEPSEPPFRRVELSRGGVRLVLLAAEAWEREMPGFGVTPADDGESARDDTGGDEPDPEAAGDAGEGGSVTGRGAGPLLRLALEDLDTVAEGLAGTDLEVEVRESFDGPGGRRLGVVDPAGNRLLLVPAGGS